MVKQGVDYRDVMLAAAADVQEMMREFEMEMSMPQMVMEMKKLWATLPNEMREKFAKERPQEYAAFISMLKK